MATADPETLVNLIQCPICLDKFTEPKQLPTCQHTFCLDCLKDHAIYSESVECPTCRQISPIPEGGVGAFQNNLVIKQLLSVVKDAADCDECGKKIFLTECPHCKRDLCTECRDKHAKITAELAVVIDRMSRTFVKNLQADGQEAVDELQVAHNATKKMAQEMDDKFKKAFAALSERKNELMNLAQGIIFFQKYVLLKVSDADHDLNHFEAYKDAEQLEILQKRLEKLNGDPVFTRAMEKIITPEFDFDLLKLGELARIKCASDSNDNESGDTKSQLSSLGELDGEASTTLSVKRNKTSRSSLRRQSSSVTVLPKNVTYKGKHHSVDTTIVDGYPCAGKKKSEKFVIQLKKLTKRFKPKFALYSDRENMMYALSAGEVFRFNLETNEKERVSSSSRVKDFALTESGRLLLTDGSSVWHRELEEPEDDCKTMTIARTEKLAKFHKAVQICSYGEEFVVLDADQKNITIFTEAGKFIRDFGSESLSHVNEESKMCLDAEGRIYVTEFHFYDKHDIGETKCGNCDDVTPGSILPKGTHTMREQLLVKWRLTIAVFAWDGQHVKDIPLDEEAIYDYEFRKALSHQKRCPNHPFEPQNNESHEVKRQNKSVPSNEDVENRNRFGGLCVDTNGFITLTRPGRNKIDVYNQDGDHECTIADGSVEQNPGEYRNPSGVSLMPDGKLIVCDTGKHRIQLL